MYLKSIPNYPNYFAGNDGFIYCNLGFGKQKVSKNLRKLNANIQSSGRYYYLSVKHKNGKRHWQRVHRLVCMAFKKRKNIKNLTASHLDGNWKNNKPSNLKWESLKDNHARKKYHGTDDSGYKNSRALLNLKQLKKIRKLLKKGKTHMFISKIFNVDRLIITMIANNKRYKNQGF